MADESSKKTDDIQLVPKGLDGKEMETPFLQEISPEPPTGDSFGSPPLEPDDSWELNSSPHRSWQDRVGQSMPAKDKEQQPIDDAWTNFVVPDDDSDNRGHSGEL